MSYEEVAEKVFQRGRQFMNALESQGGSLHVLLPKSFAKVSLQTRPTGRTAPFGREDVDFCGPQNDPLAEPDPRKSPEDTHFALARSFLEGMMSAASPNSKFTDLLAANYSNDETSLFAFWKDFHFRNAPAQVSSRLRSKFLSEFGLGVATFYDMIMGIAHDDKSEKKPTPFPDYASLLFWLKTDLVENAIYNALLTSDEYAWLYTEEVNIWGTKGSPDDQKGRKPPPDWFYKVVRSAQEKVATGKPLGYDLWKTTSDLGPDYYDQSKNPSEFIGRGNQVPDVFDRCTLPKKADSSIGLSVRKDLEQRRLKVTVSMGDLQQIEMVQFYFNAVPNGRLLKGEGNSITFTHVPLGTHTLTARAFFKKPSAAQPLTDALGDKHVSSNPVTFDFK